MAALLLDDALLKCVDEVNSYKTKCVSFWATCIQCFLYLFCALDISRNTFHRS